MTNPPTTFNDLLRLAVSVTIDTREGLDPTQHDPCITITLADGTEVYVAQDGVGGVSWGSGSAA